MPGGRPSTYSPEIAAFICSRISNGESVRKICDDPDMPASSSIFKWLIEHKEFSEQYTRAREAQMDAMVEEIIEIADDSANDSTFDEEGNSRQNSEWINRSRLRVDTRKWLMSKLAPKKYGDKIQQEHTGTLGVQLVHSVPRPERKEE
jgi:hypothetical protein